MLVSLSSGVARSLLLTLFPIKLGKASSWLWFGIVAWTHHGVG